MTELARTRTFVAVLALALPVSLGGCAEDSWLFAKAWDGYSEETRQAQPAAPPAPMDIPRRPSALSNTHWRLAEIQEAGGRISRPDDPAKYTITFGSDGVVLMQLNCNRARGSWSAQAHEMGLNGLSIGPLVKTYDMCEPPSLDERVAHDMEHVRSYRIEGGRLYLDLMLDGGTYVLEQIEPVYDQRS